MTAAFEVNEQLLSDTHGLIQNLAIALPAAALDKSSEYEKAVKSALGAFLMACDKDISVFILVEKGQQLAATRWVAKLSPQCQTIVVDTAPVGEMSRDALWIRDTMLVSNYENQTQYLLPRHDRSLDQIHGAWLSKFNNIGTRVEAFNLAGGNQLVTQHSRIVGVSSVEFTRATAAGPTTFSYAQNILQGIDAKPMQLYCFSCDDLDENFRIPLSRIQGFVKDIWPKVELPKEIADRIKKNELNKTVSHEQVSVREILGTTTPRQYHRHVDLMLSATGISREGKELLFLAELVMPDEAAGEDQENQIRDRNFLLAATQKNLESSGFFVVRNPIPYRQIPGSYNYQPRYYNNVLLDGAIRPTMGKQIVWLPGYGRDEPILRSFDERNSTMWANLGFVPRLVQGWNSFANSDGALRCATQVLTRINLETIHSSETA